MRADAPGRDAIALHWQGPEGAPALLLMNSLGTDQRVWDDVVSALNAEGDRGALLIARFDYPGHGGQPVGAGYTIASLAERVSRAVAAAGVARCHVVGLSMGGAVALALAAHHPECVASLVLSNAAAAFGAAGFWNARIATAEREGLAALADATIERWLTPQHARREPGLAARLRAMFVATRTAGYVQACAAVRDVQAHAWLARITVPTLVHVSTHDEATPAALGREIAAGIAGARCVERPGAHLGPLADPAGFARLVRQSIEEARDVSHH